MHDLRHAMAEKPYLGTSPQHASHRAPGTRPAQDRQHGSPILAQDTVADVGDVPFPTRRFLGVRVCVSGRDQVLEFLLRRLSARMSTKVAFANMNLLNHVDRNGFPVRALDDFLVLNDGVGLDIASLALYGSAFPDNLNGTDLVPALLARASKDTRVFLYGATPKVVEHAARILPELCQVTICGTCDGYGVAADRRGVVQGIRDAKADIVLVALGNPDQEQWIEENALALGAPLVIAVGALFDIVTGTYPRAPLWVRRSRLEWVYRFALEPSRLWRRYTREAIAFFFKVLWHR